MWKFSTCWGVLCFDSDLLFFFMALSRKLYVSVNESMVVCEFWNKGVDRTVPKDERLPSCYFFSMPAHALFRQYVPTHLWNGVFVSKVSDVVAYPCVFRCTCICIRSFCDIHREICVFVTFHCIWIMYLIELNTQFKGAFLVPWSHVSFLYLNLDLPEHYILLVSRLVLCD